MIFIHGDIDRGPAIGYRFRSDLVVRRLRQNNFITGTNKSIGHLLDHFRGPGADTNLLGIQSQMICYS